MNYGLYFILSFLVISCFASFNIVEAFDTEKGLIEILQLIVLFLSSYFHIRHFKKLSKTYNSYLLKTKIFLIILLFYEEASFITKNFFSLTSTINYKNELNLHNTFLFQENIIENLQIPFLKINFDISFFYLISFIVLFFIFIFSYYPVKKSLQILFLEKKYAFFSLVYPANIIFSYILFEKDMIKNIFIIHPEMFELFIYTVIMVDTFSKLEKNKILNKF